MRLKEFKSIMPNTRKALNFDLNESILKKSYPNNSYKNAWNDIRKHLENNQFIHRQYSGYVSSTSISMSKVMAIVEELSFKHPWLKESIIQFDVTIVGNEYSLIHIL